MIKVWASFFFLMVATLTYADVRLPWQKGDETLLSGFPKSGSFQQKLAAATKAGKNERRYALGDHGFFRVEIPSSWNDELRQPADLLPPMIVLSPESGSASRVLITPTWVKERGAPSDEMIKASVRRYADQAKFQAVEQTLDLVEIQGTSGNGYYFFATDKTPNPGEWKYLTQGVLVVGQLMVTFTILTNDKQSEVTKEALTVLKEARHLK